MSYPLVAEYDGVFPSLMQGINLLPTAQIAANVDATELPYRGSIGLANRDSSMGGRPGEIALVQSVIVQTNVLLYIAGNISSPTAAAVTATANVDSPYGTLSTISLRLINYQPITYAATAAAVYIFQGSAQLSQSVQISSGSGLTANIVATVALPIPLQTGAPPAVVAGAAVNPPAQLDALLVAGGGTAGGVDSDTYAILGGSVYQQGEPTS